MVEICPIYGGNLSIQLKTRHNARLFTLQSYSCNHTLHVHCAVRMNARRTIIAIALPAQIAIHFKYGNRSF